jgi:hypothetical protein
MKDFKVIPFDIQYSSVSSSGPNDDQGRTVCVCLCGSVAKNLVIE